jgi:hypothetical protein
MCTAWCQGAQIGPQVAMATNFFRAAPNVCGYSIVNMLHDSRLAPRMFRWLLDTRKICPPLGWCKVDDLGQCQSAIKSTRTFYYTAHKLISMEIRVA